MELLRLLSKYSLFGRLKFVKRITINLSHYLLAAEMVFTLMVEKFPLVLCNREPYSLRLTEPG